MASKSLIDKDTMYKKIMPSAKPKAAEPAEQLTNESMASPTPETAEFVPPLISAIRTIPSEPLKPGEGVSLKAKAREEVLINVMEGLVVDRLEAAFLKFNCCRCDKCKKDVAALSLNILKPLYVVADEEGLTEITAKQNTAEINTAIIKAILKVRSNPRHGGAGARR